MSDRCLDDDDGSPIMELDQNGFVLAMNGYGPTGWVARDYPTGSALATTFGAQDYSYTYDPEGNLVQRHPEIAAGADGMDLNLYDAFGNHLADVATATGNPETLIDPVGFGGEYGYYFDKETGKSLVGHRYYDPLVGRFVNRDPIDYNGGINLYSYAGNNPITERDPSGFAPPTVAPELMPLIEKYLGWAGVKAAFGYGARVVGGTALLTATLFFDSAKGTSTQDVPDFSGTYGKRTNKPATASSGSGSGGVMRPPRLASPSSSDDDESGSVYYRGGPTLSARSCDVKINKQTGLVEPLRGPSLNTDPNNVNVLRNGGAYRVESVPDELQIRPQGGPGHYEIIPREPMTLDSSTICLAK
jgi:RHS repeat-associated protein